MATIVIPTLADDIPRLNICLKSIRKFLVPKDFKLIVLTPLGDKLEVEKTVDDLELEGLSVSVITDDVVLPDIKQYTIGWARVQILKLLCATIVDTDFFLILNSSNILVKPLSIEDIIQNNKAVMHYGNWSSSLQDAYQLFEETCPDPNMDVMRMTPAILSTYLTLDMLTYLTKKNSPLNTTLPNFLYTTVQTIPWYVMYFAYYKINMERVNPHYTGNLWGEYNVKNPYNFLTWDTKSIFSSTQEGFFFITNLVWDVPSEIVYDLFKSQLECTVTEKAFPMISCILVARNIADINSSVRQYQAQTYPNKELIIVQNQVPEEYIKSLSDTSIKVVNGVGTDSDLKKMGEEKAIGEFIINWDVNSWYHASRMSVQYGKGVNNGSVIGNVIVVTPGSPYFTISDESGLQNSTVMYKKGEGVDNNAYKIPGEEYSMLAICYLQKSSQVKSTMIKGVKNFDGKTKESVSQMVRGLGNMNNKVLMNALVNQEKPVNPSKFVITDSDKEKIQKVQILLLVGLNVYLMYKLIQSV